MPDFSQRSLLPEKMDQNGVAVSEIHRALKELEVINKWLGGYHVILNALEQETWNGPLTIMDLGCGGGDMLRAIADWAKKKKRQVNLIGIDMNPIMTEYASTHSQQYSNIHFKTLNVFDDALLNEKADITMNSLFCHHFNQQELIALLKRMYQLSTRSVLINDLHRHLIAYYSIKLLTSVFSGTYLVKYDGPLSVARALNRMEWEEVLNGAGIADYKLRWMWAWRWQLIIGK